MKPIKPGHETPIQPAIQLEKGRAPVGEWARTTLKKLKKGPSGRTEILEAILQCLSCLKPANKRVNLILMIH
jgi:hypothetical protein